MTTTKNINYKFYTKLPTEIFNKADKANPVIEVLTPHKGVVFVEIKKVDSGLFRKATEVDRKTVDVISELLELERQAKDYLLDKWVSSLNN